MIRNLTLRVHTKEYGSQLHKMNTHIPLQIVLPIRTENIDLVANCESSFASSSQVKIKNSNSDPSAYCLSLKTLT